MSGAFGRILEVLREAEALATALDDARRLGRVFVFLTIHFFFAGHPDEAIPVGQRALALAAASSDVGLYAVANTYLGFVYQHQGNYPQAMDCYGRAVAALDGPLRHERFGQVVLPAVLSRTCLALCLAEVGSFAEPRVPHAFERRVDETALGAPRLLDQLRPALHVGLGVGLEPAVDAALAHFL